MYGFFYTAGIGDHGREYADMVSASSESEARTEFWKRRASSGFDWIQINSVMLEG